MPTRSLVTWKHQGKSTTAIMFMSKVSSVFLMMCSAFFFFFYVTIVPFQFHSHGHWFTWLWTAPLLSSVCEKNDALRVIWNKQRDWRLMLTVPFQAPSHRSQFFFSSLFLDHRSGLVTTALSCWLKSRSIKSQPRQSHFSEGELLETFHYDISPSHIAVLPLKTLEIITIRIHFYHG